MLAVVASQSPGFVVSTPGLTSDKVLTFSSDSMLPLFLARVVNFDRVGFAPPAGPPPVGAPVPAPRPYVVASSAFLPFFLSGCSLARVGGTVPTGWRQVSAFTFALTGVAITRILDALIDAGLLLTPVMTPDDLVAAVSRTSRLIPAPALGMAHPLVLTLDDLDRVVDPFTALPPPLFALPPPPEAAVVAGGRGRGRGAMLLPPPPPPLPVVGVAVEAWPLPAIVDPSLAPIRWLSLVSISAYEDLGRARPLETLARVLHVIGACSTSDSRRGEMSAVAAGVEALASGVRRQLGPGVAAASVDAAMAFLLQGHLLALLDTFPSCYRHHASNTEQARMRHVMECDFVFGRDADRERVEVLCVDDISETAPNLTVLVSRCPSQGERRAAIRSLATLYLGNTALREPIHQILLATESEVAVRRHVYAHFLNEG